LAGGSGAALQSAQHLRPAVAAKIALIARSPLIIPLASSAKSYCRSKKLLPRPNARAPKVRPVSAWARPGAAWRGVRDGTEKFERVLEIVREVSPFDMEVCVTLGEIGPVEARKLKAAGVTAYNHNIDTSPEFYPEIVSTHTFQDRLKTIAAVQASGMSVSSGGIIGMGESENDRLRMIEVLSNFDPPPESVPINRRSTSFNS
jgi:biotin synthase-like enzyme